MCVYSNPEIRGESAAQSVLQATAFHMYCPVHCIAVEEQLLKPAGTGTREEDGRGRGGGGGDNLRALRQDEVERKDLHFISAATQIDKVAIVCELLDQLFGLNTPALTQAHVSNRDL